MYTGNLLPVAIFFSLFVFTVPKLHYTASHHIPSSPVDKHCTLRFRFVSFRSSFFRMCIFVHKPDSIARIQRSFHINALVRIAEGNGRIMFTARDFARD